MTTWQCHQQQSCASKRSRVPRRIEQRAAPCMSHPTKSHGRAWGREEGGVRRERCGGGGGGCSGGDDDRDGNVGLRCEGGRGLGWWWRWWIELVCPLSFAVHLSNFLSVSLPVSVFPVSLCLSLCLSFCLVVSVCLCLSLPLSPSLLSVCLSVLISLSLFACLYLWLPLSLCLGLSIFISPPPPPPLSHYLYPVSKRNPWQTWAADAEVNFFVCYSVCLSRKPHGIGFRMSACVCGV